MFFRPPHSSRFRRLLVLVVFASAGAPNLAGCDYDEPSEDVGAGEGRWSTQNSFPQHSVGNDERGQLVRLLAGNGLKITWREGEALFGTYYVEEVSLCRDQRFSSRGWSTRETLAGNTDTRQWHDHGHWTIERGPVGYFVQIHSATQQDSSIPVGLDHAGRLQLPPEAVFHDGVAGC